MLAVSHGDLSHTGKIALEAGLTAVYHIGSACLIEMQLGWEQLLASAEQQEV